MIIRGEDQFLRLKTWADLVMSHYLLFEDLLVTASFYARWLALSSASMNTIVRFLNVNSVFKLPFMSCPSVFHFNSRLLDSCEHLNLISQ